MDVFQAVGAAVSLASTICRIWISVGTFLEQAGQIDSTFAALEQHITSLHDNLHNVAATIRAQARNDESFIPLFTVEGGPSIAKQLNDSRDRCLATVARLQKTIDAIKISHSGSRISQSDFIVRCRRQLQLNGRNTTIEQLIAVLDREEKRQQQALTCSVSIRQEEISIRQREILEQILRQRAIGSQQPEAIHVSGYSVSQPASPARSPTTTHASSSTTSSLVVTEPLPCYAFRDPWKAQDDKEFEIGTGHMLAAEPSSFVSGPSPSQGAEEMKAKVGQKLPTRVIAAIKNPDVKDLKQILKQKPYYITSADTKGWTLFHHAVKHHANNQQTDALKYLLRFLKTNNPNSNVTNATTNDGKSPISFAVQQKWPAALALLVKAGATITDDKNNGSSLLMIAIRDGCEEIIRTLGQNGARLDKELMKKLSSNQKGLYLKAIEPKQANSKEEASRQRTQSTSVRTCSIDTRASSNRGRKGSCPSGGRALSTSSTSSTVPTLVCRKLNCSACSKTAF